MRNSVIGEVDKEKKSTALVPSVKPYIPENETTRNFMIIMDLEPKKILKLKYKYVKFRNKEQYNKIIVIKRKKKINQGSRLSR